MLDNNSSNQEVISGDLNDEGTVTYKKTFRDGLYGRIKVSVKTMDIIITVLMIALVASIVIGAII